MFIQAIANVSFWTHRIIIERKTGKNGNDDGEQIGDEICQRQQQASKVRGQFQVIYLQRCFFSFFK